MAMQKFYNQITVPEIQLNGSLMNGVTSTIGATPSASILPNEIAVTQAITANNTDVVTPAIAAAVSPVAAQVATLQTTVATLTTGATVYSVSVTATNWLGGGASDYTYTIPAATHNKGVRPVVATLDTAGNIVIPGINYDPATGGVITLSCYGGTAASDLSMMILVSTR